MRKKIGIAGLVLLCLWLPYAWAARGTLTIESVVDNGDGSYTLTVTSSTGVVTSDHLGATLSTGDGAVYEVTSVPSSISVIVSDTLTEDQGAAFGAPVAGSGWYSTPTAEGFSKPPYNGVGWDAPLRRNEEIKGTIATQNANNVAITGGSVTGITDLAIADGGTAASTAGGARVSFGFPSAIPADGTFLVSDGATYVAESGNTAASSLDEELGDIAALSLTEGDILLVDGTGSITNLAIGANTYVLQSNGTTASWVAGGAGGEDFAATLALGNSSGANDVEIGTGQVIDQNAAEALVFGQSSTTNTNATSYQFYESGTGGAKTYLDINPGADDVEITAAGGGTNDIKLDGDGAVYLMTVNDGTVYVHSIVDTDTSTVLQLGGTNATSARFVDPGSTDYLDFDHDGTDATISTNDGHIKLTPTDNVQVTTGQITLSTDVGLQRAAAGDLKVTNGSTGSGDLHMGDDGEIVHGDGRDVFQLGETTTGLTSGSAQTVFSVVSADGDMAGLTITYTIQVSTATPEYQSEHGTVQVAFVDKSTGVTAATPSEMSVQALSAGTLTSTWSVVTTDDQSIEIQVNPTTSLSTPTIQVRWHVIATGDVTITVP